MLNGLVHSDGPVEDHTVARILGCAAQCVLTNADGLYRHQNALGIQAIKQVFEALPFFANTVLVRNKKIVDEHGIGINRRAAMLWNAPYLDLALVQIGIEQGNAIGGLFAFGLGRGTCQQQNLVGHLCGGRPHLAPGDAVAAFNFFGKGLDAGGIQPRIRLGHAKTHLVLASHQTRQPPGLLLGAAMHNHRVRAEHVDVDG